MPRTRRPEGAQRWEPHFRDFIGHLSIDSKESGISKLTAENIYDAQNRFLAEVCEGLDRNIRHFVCLKARQLGITTISLAMDLFWLYIHPGMQGALVTDDEGNREKFRIILERYINSLPKGLRIGIKKHNRHSLVLNNGSVLDYLVAGKKRKTGGTGVSRAFNFLHATEVSNYGDPDAISDLVATLAQTHPDRLYIFESTARGFNGFWDMWQDAQTDTHTQKPFFIGWWAKDIYELPKASAQYKEYWDGNLSDDERERVQLVRQKYGVKMRSSQVAWYRWMQAVKIPSTDKMMQEYPWTEEEAFVATGQTFFHQRRVAQDIQFITDANNGLVFKGYRYHMGKDFAATELEQVANPAFADLRVWEDPHPNGVYAIGMDPAYGRSDHKDRHSIQVFRCYADCVRQVAEYATEIPETYQAAWVLCHLAGTYKDCMINLEINGPGAVIMNELRTLRLLIDSPGYREEFEKRGMADVFNAVRWFLYHRPDSMGAGYVYSWKTTQDNKLLLLNEYRDAYATGQLGIRSMLLLEEMQKIVQDGGTIEASGRSKDDRVFAAALAVKTWKDWLRSPLLAENRVFKTVQSEEERERSREGQSVNFVGSIIGDFFKTKEIEREERVIQRMWSNPDFIGVQVPWTK